MLIINKILGRYLLISIIISFLLWIYYAKKKILPKFYEMQNAWHKLDIEIKFFLEIVENLLEEIKTTIGVEQQIMADIAKNRKYILISDGAESKTIEMGRLNSKLDQLLENVFTFFPSLKENPEIFLLIDKLKIIKQNLNNLTKIYNSKADSYNTFIKNFPYNLPASMLGYEAHLNFATEKKDEKIRNSPKSKK